jgi:high-affinity iron transporter
VEHRLAARRKTRIAGRLLHTLVGYSEAPDGAQIIAYLATIAMMLGLMRTVGKSAPRPTAVPQAGE